MGLPSAGLVCWTSPDDFIDCWFFTSVSFPCVITAAAAALCQVVLVAKLHFCFSLVYLYFVLFFFLYFLFSACLSESSSLFYVWPPASYSWMKDFAFQTSHPCLASLFCTWVHTRPPSQNHIVWNVCISCFSSFTGYSLTSILFTGLCLLCCFVGLFW